MATLKQVRDKADAKLAQFWQMLQEKQAGYFQKHGKYFQLLVTGGSGVGNGEEYDFSKNLPSDEVYAVDVDFPWVDRLPFQIEVHEFSRGDTAGFKARVLVEWNGNRYSRHRDSNQNDTGWFQVPAITD